MNNSSEGWWHGEDKLTHEIGARFWFRGDEVEIISTPVMIHGGEFQKAIVLETKKEVWVITPGQARKSEKERQENHIRSQEAFRRLRENTKNGNS